MVLGVCCLSDIIGGKGVLALRSHSGFIRWNNFLTLRDRNPVYLPPRLDLARPAESGVFEVRSPGEEQNRDKRLHRLCPVFTSQSAPTLREEIVKDDSS